MSVIDDHHELLAAVQTLSEPLTCPPEVGQRVRSHTVPIDEELQMKVIELLVDLGWQGLSSLMWVLPEDQKPRLVDFNARHVASFDQYIAAGPNFPAIWARLVTGTGNSHREPGPKWA